MAKLEDLITDTSFTTAAKGKVSFLPDPQPVPDSVIADPNAF
jgi:hypothetical protein